MSASRISLAIAAVCCRSFPRWSISAPAVTLDRRNAITEFGSSGNDRVMYAHLPYESLLRCCSFCYWSHLPISTKGVICRSTFSERISISFKFFFFFSCLFSFKGMMGPAKSLLPPLPGCCRDGAGGAVLPCGLSKQRWLFSLFTEAGAGRYLLALNLFPSLHS